MESAGLTSDARVRRRRSGRLVSQGRRIEEPAKQGAGRRN
jgi:hypothetical protein